MSKKQRVGIYGGTFSPPHIAHVAVAKSFVDALMLDKLLVIPTFVPPHKEYDGAVSAEDRLNMCKLAFCDIKNAEISDMEIIRGGKSYTVITLEALADSDKELFLMCGTDMFLTFDTWYNYERIFELATICYVRRESTDENSRLIEQKENEYKEKYGAKIVAVENSVIEISSTELRSDSKALRSQFLPPRVLDYINDRGLYR